MPDYRRYRVPGGTYFFTINLLERRADLLVRHIKPLREAVKRTRAERPFHIDAWAVLPDHMHCVMTLPPGDDDFSNRIIEPCIISEVTREAAQLVSRMHKRALCASASRPVAYAPQSSGARNPQRRSEAVHAV